MSSRRAAHILNLLVVATALSFGRQPAALASEQAICTPQTLGPATIDIPSVVIEPRFRLNGQRFPASDGGVAVFTLWASDPLELFNGPQLVLGESNWPSQTVRIVPGVYDVYYSWISGTGVPRNEFTRVMHRVPLETDGTLVIDVPMVHIAGVKLHNGVEFNFEGAATMNLRSLDGPGVVPLGAVQPAEFEQAIIPGRYAVEYDWQQGANFPNNRQAVIAQLDLSESIDDLEFNVRSVIQPLQFLHNGATFPDSPYDYGDMVLWRREREEVFIGPSYESSVAIRVIPGSYHVHWRHVAGGTVPRNSDGRLPRRLRANGEPRVIDVPSVQVSGTLLLNGAPPPAHQFENARISLAGRGGQDRLLLGETRHGAYQMLVVPGTYDIVYEHLAGGAIMPRNPRATLARRWRVAESPVRTIDIPVGFYSGAFRLSGGDFLNSEVDRGQIHAVPLANDAAPVYLGMTNHGGFDSPLLPGRYRAAFTHVAGGVLTTPQNLFTVFGPARRVIKGTEVAGDLDVRAGLLDVSYLHNGTQLAEGGPEVARAHLVWGAGSLTLRHVADTPGPILAMTGPFNIYYEYRTGPGLPVNVFMPIGCWTLTQ